MSGRARRRGAAAALLILGLSVAAGCDKKKEVPAAPEPGPSLEAMWPNDDGRSWTYRAVRRVWGDRVLVLYESPDLVPHAPTLGEVAELLRDHPVGSDATADTGWYRLAFDGQITTLSGVTAQNLAESHPTTPFARGLRPGRGTRAWRPAVALRGDGPLEHVLRVRPDLGRGRHGSSPVAAAPLDSPPRGPLLLHGYAWRKTRSWIGTYGDADTSLAWKFLTSALAPGSEFRHQLVPTLDDDVYLYGHVLGPRAVETPAGRFENVTECLYLVDFGVSVFTLGTGDTLGYARFISYGTIAYVSGVGPVASYERLDVEAGAIPSAGSGDATFLLTATGPAAGARAAR